jgi:biopolymer transport protein ExbD
MAIFRPGERHRYHNILSKRKNKRSVTAMLSLTAMVDMFTVLVIFLLQNYNTTGEILYIPKEVTLPKAQIVNELKPAVVVTISNKEVLLDTTPVVSFDEVKAQTEWLIPALRDQVQLALQKAKSDYEQKLQVQLQTSVNKALGQEAQKFDWKQVTLQADKNIDFLTLKKVLFSIQSAGSGQINFAVTKETNKEATQ